MKRLLALCIIPFSFICSSEILTPRIARYLKSRPSKPIKTMGEEEINSYYRKIGGDSFLRRTTAVLDESPTVNQQPSKKIYSVPLDQMFLTAFVHVGVVQYYTLFPK